MSTEIETGPNTTLIRSEGRMVPPTKPVATAKEIIKQVNLIQDVLRQVMKDGVHYATLSQLQGMKARKGEKPILLKPGAEKIGLTFRLVPTYRAERIDLGDGHLAFQVQCSLTHAPSGVPMGEGVGYASSHEPKWRYTWRNTGRPVPREYWDARDPELIGGSDFSVRQTWENAPGPGNKRQQVNRIFQRHEISDPAGVANTILKMAKKRAHVDAIVTATAASDVFDQDRIEVDDDTGDTDVNLGTYDPPGNPVPDPKPQTLAIAFRKMGIKDRDLRLQAVEYIVGHEVKTTKDLKADEILAAIQLLEAFIDATEDPNVAGEALVYAVQNQQKLSDPAAAVAAFHMGL